MAKSMNIPQDIIDNVIAAVGDDERLLKKCALVSSSFLRPSRKQLFSKITIGSGKHCERIHQILVQNPAIPSFVRTISLRITADAPMIELASWGAETSDSDSEQWMRTSLLAILQLPFCSLECFSIIVCRDAPGVWTTWYWNHFSSEVKDALSNIIHSPTFETLFLSGIAKVPTTFFLRIVHLKTLVLDSLFPNDFGGENSSMLTQAMASHLVIDRCVWRFGEQNASASFWITESKFLPFVCRLRSLEIDICYISASMYGFRSLSFLMASLCTSFTSPPTLELLEFNIWFHGPRGVSRFNFNIHSLYDNLRVGKAWSHLDSIATHPAGSRLQRVGINIDYTFCEEYDGPDLEPDKDEILKALLDGLPLLRRKGILFVEAVVETRVT